MIECKISIFVLGRNNVFPFVTKLSLPNDTYFAEVDRHIYISNLRNLQSLANSDKSVSSLRQIQLAVACIEPMAFIFISRREFCK